MTTLGTDSIGYLDWSSPARGRWTATGPEGMVGMIERLGDRYVAMAADGRSIGKFRDLGHAQRAIDPDLEWLSEQRIELVALVLAVLAAATAAIAVWSMFR